MSRRLYREFYLLPRGEQRGLIILSALLILSLLFRITVRLLPERDPEGLEEFEKEARLMAALAEADSLSLMRQESPRKGSAAYPGKASASYRRNFRSAADQPVDINKTDSAGLLPLPGIGPVFAGRIIKYRNLLGGFVSVEQLGEVYGIPAETVQRIRGELLIDSSLVRKIQINNASFRELLRHPYLEYEDVKALLDYRDFKRVIKSSDELGMNHILSDSTLRKLDGYFDYR